ncbi:MAG: 4Fe-4S binding protein [Candidatus Bathyarchaeia archaeon]
MVKIVVDYAKCVGDPYRLCVEICPAAVFIIKKTGKPEIANEENCTMCRACQVNCPKQAILILP